MFATRNELKEQLAAASADVARLEGELAEASSHAAEAANLSERITELEGDLSAATADLSAAQEEIATLTEDLTAAREALQPENVASLIATAYSSEEEADAPIREAVQNLVTIEVAKCGVRPLDLEGNRMPDAPAAAKSMPRSEFNSLSPRQRSEFCLNGGTITEDSE